MMRGNTRGEALTFSVVIPTFNRPLQLRECLNGLAMQDFPQTAFEVIVVDDGGAVRLDGLADLSRSRLSIVVLRQENSGPASARNLGARHAKGRFIAFIDDDCVPAGDWLRRLSENFGEGSDGLLCGGHVRNGLPENVYSAASQILLEVVYVWQHHADAPRFFTTNNLAVSAQRFLKCGGLNPLFRVSEDREFCDRWVHKGGRLKYVPEAVVFHKHDLSFRAFVRQHFSYGGGGYRFYWLRAQRGWGRLRVDLRFYMRLLHVTVKGPYRRRLLTLGAVLMSQFANVCGYFWEKFFGSPVEKSELTSLDD